MEGLSGVFSGIDTDTLVRYGLQAHQARIQRLQNQKSQLEAQDTALAEFQRRLDQLYDLADDLRDSRQLRQVQPSSSDTDVAYATISGSRGEGVYQVEVNRLANAETEVHDGISSRETVLGPLRSEATSVNGVSDTSDETWFTTSVNGATYTFDFGTEDDISDVVFEPATDYTLQDVVDLINARSQAVAEYDAASIEEVDGTYYLKLEAKELGAVGELSVTLTAGDAIDPIHDDVDWDKTDGQDPSEFVYTYGTGDDAVTRTIELTEGATLDTLVDLINDDNNNPGVTASLLQYDGGGGEYHLVLTGRDSGGDYAVTIDAATTLAGFEAATWTETVTARDSQFRINGYPTSDWIERNTNTVTDAIPGATLYLTGAGTDTETGKTTITLNRTTQTLKDNLNNLASIINGLNMKLEEYTGYDQDTEESGVLQGDYFLLSVYNSVVNTITNRAAGFADGDGGETFTLPAQIGLEVADKTGEVTFDASTFSDAVDEDYLAVLELIGAQATGATSSADVEFAGAADSTTAGTYDLQIDYDAEGNITEARIKLQSEEEYRTMTVSDNETLTGEYGNPEQYLELEVLQGGTSETKEYTVRVKQGFTGALYDQLDGVLDAIDGTMQAKRDSYSNTKGTGQIDQLDKRIEREQIRLEETEERLRAKYARLEATLAELDAQRGAFESLFQALENIQSKVNSNN